MALKVKTYNNVQANVTFSKASSRVEINPTAGEAATENIALTLGKISKWYDSLVPTGGSSGKFLGWNSSGTAKWVDAPTAEDKNMSQTLKTDNVNRPLLMSIESTSNTTATVTTTGARNNSMYGNVSTGLIFCRGREISNVTLKTGTTAQSHITLNTLMTWLITSKQYIPSGKFCHVVLSTAWDYANSDILQVSINGTNYEIQLAGVIIEFMGSATSYNAGTFRLLIHSSPTTSFTAATGYTKFPTATTAEYTCNGSSYSPVWKMILNAHPTITVSADTTSNTPLSHGGTFTAITSVTRDSNGHTTKVNTATYTLPSDNNTTYTFATGDAVGQFKVKASTASGYTNYNVNGISAGTASGTANLMAYYSTATKISSTPKMAYHEINSTASTPVQRNILHLFGAGVGNDAPNLISGTVGIISYGDGGPQINFNTAGTDTITGGQNGAIIFTDHDSAATGVSWHFVSDQTDWNVISKRFHAKTAISIGTDKPPSTTYTFYVAGSSYYTGDIVIGTSGSSSNDSGDIAWKYGNGNEKARIWFEDTYTTKQGPRFRLYKSDGTSLYSGYLPLADGTSASGTWGISITGTAASANKLNTNAGSTNRPVYFSGGIPVICDTPVSGKWWNGVPYVGSNGVLEIGKYIDFHGTDTTTADYDYRILAGSSWLDLASPTTQNKITVASPDYSVIQFQTTKTGYTATQPVIYAYPLTTSGLSVLFQSGGNTVIGGGESASTLYTNDYDSMTTAENESLYLASDSSEIHLITNAQSYGTRKVLKVADGQLVKSGGQWISARDTAPVYANKPNTQDGGYYPAWFAKTKSGGWSMGVLSNQDNLYITYTTDADYSADPRQNQNTYLIQFQNKSGTVALTSDLSGYLPSTTKYAASASVGGPATKINTSEGTSDGARPVFYAYLGDNQQVVYHSSFTYNPTGGVLTATRFAGNADTATKWKTARTLTIGSTGKSVDGSGNVSWSLSEIGAASSSHTHNSLYAVSSSSAVPSTTLSAGQFKVFYNVNAGLANNMPASNNANFIIQLNKHSGNYDSQLGFSSNGNIYYRNFNAETIGSQSWRTILDSDNLEAEAKHLDSYSAAVYTSIPINPIAYPLSGFHRSNKLAFIPAANITIEYSTDGGSTWVDYGVSNDVKRDLFINKRGSSVNIGPSSGDRTTSMMTRVIVETDGRDATLDRFLIQLDSGYHNVAVDIYVAHVNSPTTYTKAATGNGTGTWAYEYEINLKHNASVYYRFSNSYYKKIAFYFRYTSVTAANKSTSSAFCGIMGFTGSYWGNDCKSNFANLDHLYTWDRDQNVTFPANVTAPKFAGPLNVSRVTKDSKAFPGANKAIIEEYVGGANYNLPSSQYYHIISIQGPDTKYGTQLALGMTTTGAYYRNYNNQTWSDWKSIINTNTTYTLGTSGNNVTLTPSSGSAQSITVPYATNAGNVYGTVTNGTTTTTRYGVVFAADPNTSENNTMRKTYDFRINLTNGSTSTTGMAELVLGNEKAKNTSDNKQGSLTLYSSGTSYHEIYVAETNSAIAHTFPATAGTILNSGTTSWTQTVASSATGAYQIGKIKINGSETVVYGVNTDTNTKVTSSANHYAPSTVSGQDKTASASGATAAWSIDVVKGITINTDGKGHITGLSVTSGKIPANPNTNTTYTLETSGDTVTLTPSSGSVQSITVPYATKAQYPMVIASNELRLYNDNQFKADNQFWIGYSWAPGSHYTPTGGTDTASTTAPNITKYFMGNCSGGGLASVHAKTFILGNGSSPTSSSTSTTIATAATTNRTITLPNASGTVSLEGHTHNYAGSASAGGPANSVATTEANANADRVVFFADNTDTKKLVYDNDFKYNPSTGILNAGRLTLTSSTWGGLTINRTAANAHAGIVFQQNGTDLGSISMGEADSPLIRWKGNTAYKVYDEGNVQPMLWRYTPEDDPTTATNAGLYPAYTMAFMQNSSGFGGTANRRGNSGTNYWAHYITFTHSSNYRYLLRLPFWGVPQYQHTSDGSNQRWYSFVTEEEFSAYKALQERNYSASAAGWYRVLTLAVEGGSSTGKLIREVTLYVQRNYNNADAEGFGVRIHFHYSTETFSFIYAKQNYKCFTKIRTTKSSDSSKVNIELYYDFAKANDFAVRIDTIKSWPVSNDSYMPKTAMPDSGSITPVSDSPTVKNVVDIPTDVLQSNLKLIGSYWGICGPDGNDSSYIRTSADGLLPYEAGGITNPHTYIGTSTNYFSAGYIKYINAGEINTYKDDSTRQITYGYDTIDFKYNSTGGWATGVQWKANNAVLTSIGGYGTGTGLNYMWIGGSNYESPALKIHSNLNIEVTANHNILLRTHANGTYKAGIGYDTQGNECVAFWAKNAVTRFRFHSGVDMETISAGSMMGINPDFEIYHTAVTSTVPFVLWNPSGGNTPELIFRRKTDGDDYVDWRVVNSSANLYFDYQYNSTTWTSRLWLEYNGGMGITGPLKLKTGTYTTTISQGTTTANRTLVLPDKSGGIPVANILYEDDTGAHSYKVADAKNYKYFIITVHHGSFENQTGTIVPTTLSTTTHCYFTISFVDPTSAGNIRVGSADITIAPDSSTNSITFTASASSHHLAIAGNASTLTNITTSSPTSMVIRKIVGFM